MPSTPPPPADRNARAEGHRPLPQRIDSVEQLEELLSEPSPAVVETFARLEGDVIVLGVGGKMGPTLARMALRASQAAGIRRRVIGVARFSQSGLEEQLQAEGIETIRCDLLQQRQLDGLPEVPNVVSMAAIKFGSSGNASLTWAMNAYLAGMISRKYRHSRIVAFSTGNVYPLTNVASGGSRESDPVGPVGEYAMSVLGRERIYEHFSRTLEIPLAIVRLNYACELRYGVLVDMARRVCAGEPVDLRMGYVNVIWQADANAMVLQAFGHVASPPLVFNVAGPETLSVRAVCQQFGSLMNKPATFSGSEASDALLSDGRLGYELFGRPRVSAEQIIQWTASWVMQGGTNLDKPTHFETRNGKY